MMSQRHEGWIHICFAHHCLAGTWHSVSSLVSAQRNDELTDHEEEYKHDSWKGNLKILKFNTLHVQIRHWRTREGR